MRTRKLGNSEIELTTVGFGAWAIGGPWEFGWGPQDDNDSIKAIREGLDAGINWIDTAPAYGHGHSERIVGKMLRDVLEKPFIATKCGIIWDETRDKITWVKEDSVINECHQSLKRLGVDVIDLYHMHWGEPNEQIEEGIGAMAKLKEQGKIRYIGVSNYTVEQIQRAQKITEIVSLQPPYSMLRRETEKELLPYCEKNNIGVVAYSPMHKGLLTGKFNEQKIAELAKDDHRRRDPEFNGEKFKATLELVDALRPIAQRNGITLAQLSISWVLRRDEVTAAIVGARKPGQIQETAKASDVDLDEQTIGEIEGLLERCRQRINK